MTAIKTINDALVSRGMMPLDGYCACGACGRSDLNRDDLSKSGYCLPCVEDAASYGAYSTAPRNDEQLIETRYDYARQVRVQV